MSYLPESAADILKNTDELPSPSLIIFTDKIETNIRKMVEIAGGPERLRPHVKTHKIAEIVALQRKAGIQRFKCSTLSEVSMLAKINVDDILLAMQPVGPEIQCLIRFVEDYPDTQIATIVDNLRSIENLESQCESANTKVAVYLDLNIGMNRTGVLPGSIAVSLIKRIYESPSLVFRGLHAYDGHILDSDTMERQCHCDKDFAPVNTLIQTLSDLGLPTPNIVAGGSPTFPIHAQRENVELSPGTPLLWDFGYGDCFKDLPFQYAALLFTRVVSKPAKDLICLDLGYKAIASEMPHPRVRLIGLEDADFVSQSEEHLVLQTKRASEIAVGDSFFGVPRHICPTVALHNKVVVVTDGLVVGNWSVAARDRILI